MSVRAPQVDDDAAAGVVSRRDHGDRFAAHVDAEREASGQDVREVGFDEGRVLVADVQVDAIRAEALHLVVDGAGYDVPRGQLAARVEPVHEPAAVGQQQPAALAAHRFGDEERPAIRLPGRLGVVQAGGVELVELHVGDAAACPPCHGDAVAGGAVGIAGVHVDLAGAAGREHHERRFVQLHGVALAVVDVCADDLVRRAAEFLCGDDVDRRATACDIDVGVRRGPLAQDSGDRRARGVCHVQNASMGVAAFAGEVERAVLAVELKTEFDHVGDGCARAGDREVRDLGQAQTGAGIECVGDMRLETVVRRGYGGNAPLGPVRGPAPDGVLGDDGDTCRSGQTQGGREPGGTAADDEHVGSMTIRHACRSRKNCVSSVTQSIR